MRTLRDYCDSDGIYAAKNCRNCKHVISGVDLEIFSPSEYSKIKNYKKDYYCKINKSIVNSTSVCSKWKGL